MITSMGYILRFQFLQGLIKTATPEAHVASLCLFQFLQGLIKTAAAAREAPPNVSFNSYKV